MKKTLLLSVVASAVVMAGGDIAPVEPAVEAPVVEETASNWDFNGQAVIYYQTTDKGAANDLFKYYMLYFSTFKNIKEFT